MHLLIFSILLGCCEIEITTTAFFSLRKMERTTDVIISRSCKIEDEFRKMEGVQCIEWNIENFKSSLEENRLECITSPTFQMRGASWNISFRPTKKELYLVEWKTEQQRHSFTYLMNATNKDGDIRWSVLNTFLRDESESLVSEKCVGVLVHSASSMTVNNLRVSFIIFPEVEQRYSDAFKEGVAMGAETHSNAINREGRSETTENLVKIIHPSSEMESIRILPGCEIDDNLRIIDGLLCFEWNIKNYKSLAEKELDLMTSPSFQMRGARWNLFLKHTKKVVTPILYRWEYASASKSKRHSITCQITIQIREDMYRSELKTFLFNKSKCTAAGVSASLEFWSKYRTSDNLRVFCIIFPEELEQTSDTSESCVKGVETCSNTCHEGIDILVSNMKDLFLNEENCDLVIKVKGRDFHVHNAIVAVRSPVLSAMLQRDMAEKNSGSVDIVDCEPDVFEYFLRYLYTGCVEEISWSYVINLYTLADKYDLPHLSKECLQFMEGNLYIEAFCDAITLAVKHNESTLIKCAENFFLKNVKSILVTNKWQLLMKENPVICNELFLKYSK